MAGVLEPYVLNNDEIYLGNEYVNYSCEYVIVK